MNATAAAIRGGPETDLVIASKLDERTKGTTIAYRSGHHGIRDELE
jgi:hypothetical protein